MNRLKNQLERLRHQLKDNPVYSRVLIGVSSFGLVYCLLGPVEAFKTRSLYGTILLYLTGMTVGLYWLNTIHKRNSIENCARN